MQQGSIVAKETNSLAMHNDKKRKEKKPLSCAFVHNDNTSMFASVSEFNLFHYVCKCNTILSAMSTSLTGENTLVFYCTAVTFAMGKYLNCTAGSISTAWTKEGLPAVRTFPD